MSRFLDALESKVKNTDGSNVFFLAEYHEGSIEGRALASTNPCQDVYSITKAYIVTAVGLLVDRGLLDTNEILTDILLNDLPSFYNEIWSKTTVDMLLRHNVGLPKNFLDVDCDDASEYGDDYLSYVLNAPISKDFDNTSYTYTDAAFYLLSRIVEKRAGMGTDDFLWKHLLYPTECREAAFSHCPHGHVIGATGLYIRAVELVKLGMIYLHDGMYGDKRILSCEWVDTVLSRGYELKRKADGSIYGKSGMRGQSLLISPQNDRVVAWLGYGNNSFAEFVAAYRD